MLINISDEMFRNLKREPLVLPDGRKFLILEASMSGLWGSSRCCAG